MLATQPAALLAKPPLLGGAIEHPFVVAGAGDHQPATERHDGKRNRLPS